ncbi:hypothetical protein EYR40_001300 [Pleurotus pulmonarius]|nr:hypothetical protein EYR38_004539 [Pleurotus pulmonarius]KAF4608947.1 hypothetical protein EYR40_001300 [Pleurotus pulmonarius]
MYYKATNAFVISKNARFNQAQLTGLAQKLITLAQLDRNLAQPEGSDAMSLNVRALKRGSHSLISKASKFVTSYASKTYFLQLVFASQAAEKIRKFDKEAQALFDQFAQYGITVSQEVAPPTSAQVSSRQPPLRLPSMSTITFPLIVINNNRINNNTTTLIASNVGNETTVTMENVANNNPSTTLVRRDMVNTYYSGEVYEDY